MRKISNSNNNIKIHLRKKLLLVVIIKYVLNIILNSYFLHKGEKSVEKTAILFLCPSKVTQKHEFINETQQVRFGS